MAETVADAGAGRVKHGLEAVHGAVDVEAAYVVEALDGADILQAVAAGEVEVEDARQPEAVKDAPVHADSAERAADVQTVLRRHDRPERYGADGGAPENENRDALSAVLLSPAAQRLHLRLALLLAQPLVCRRHRHGPRAVGRRRVAVPAVLVLGRRRRRRRRPGVVGDGGRERRGDGLLDGDGDGLGVQGLRLSGGGRGPVGGDEAVELLLREDLGHGHGAALLHGDAEAHVLPVALRGPEG